MNLVIVESPTKTKTISKYLGGDFTVQASVGHIRDLPKSNKKAIDIKGGFIPHYEVNEDKKRIIEDLRKTAEKADQIYLATDPDREGEAIAWHISQVLELAKLKSKNEKLKVSRVVFHEITKEAIREAISHPRDIDIQLVKSQEARRVLDRLVGYDLSGLIWKKVRYGLSAGRVQSPALRILVEREREIRAFISEAYYTITARVSSKNKGVFTVACEEEIKDKEKAEKILEKSRPGSWFVKDITENEVKRLPRSPFTTSTLQQTASSRLGFSPSRTMSIAQKLYEQGFITYMRTDSVNLASSAQSQIVSFIEKTYGKEYAQPRSYKTASKNAQEAHEAIRPTNAFLEQSGYTEEQKKLYRLIRERTVASQMSDARLLKTKITANIIGEEIPNFSAVGSRVLFDGWLACDKRARGEDIELPKVSKNESLDLKEIASEEKYTEPPSRYSEAGLVKELEKRGIGRPSTYASIIKTLCDRKYAEKEGRALKPTDIGEVVSSFLEENFMNYISDTFTAEMENELDDIADGKREYAKTLQDFYIPFHKDVKAKEKIDKLTNLGSAGEEWKCPECGSSMTIKLGRGGKFMSCEKYPECKGARRIDGSVPEPNKSLGIDPETNLPIFVMEGRFGPYVQIGENPATGGKANPKPRRASIPRDKDMGTITMEDALKYLGLPRVLGTNPETGKEISANIGRFGPYVVHDKDFRSLKEDNVYSIELPRALEIFKEEKKKRSFGKSKK
ncbi:MAG: DNA topoisomerase I [Candidatus Yanofskybacteria bacterium RIFCSPHIGHO2_02_FULL_41_29]|uniref:DNA topoisomerase 1 n=1 Tax=Candidatus Yanofskybacteria bacterium RIFCSPHIGHO2_01_FULL_41_53 TaxID=1802663 RepID=A0A1F8ENA4_9BACT|nr:MAG: DNA topoisomerase I [Candidatus Yanofskybacteria bacterium RIFCSPHIGHO2_01_FULL_41_53]OGN10433.1 MAG: DNA topoisomerase I [Candidatus Yanofskybacteria bacterium RIFCSPHIGHO2_02_FULL_41_29]OGN19010.1 MAG: DNA topoisomerase I [Candidatus Yanofskybacteria bacterium RIFCSPHIGHO2_12_FULL_41_9]OGN21176.1 MAG: DNA topoisomerase I [Candidatus Yanofskybacteria bacterium RIFCSPLOWO2_01_FULL_41_67]OGN30052.1 MAG: DNA topoisomerase I [Candidatus Yanofskybacteria bacterium RIFCSPLOWO2_02_FULL_41_13]